MADLSPAYAFIDTASRAPQDPMSDPEHRLGRTPPSSVLEQEAELQRTGDAARGALLNANTPRPGEPTHNTVRDPALERWTP